MQISELPYGMWTEPYKVVLVQMCMSGRIKSFKEDHTSGSVLFRITALEVMIMLVIDFYLTPLSFFLTL